MSKFRTHHQQSPGAPPVVLAPSVPPGRWLRVSRVTENGVRGWALDELTGTLEAKRIHGPDLVEIVIGRLHDEVRRG